jgi:hypothetical protein
MTGGECLGARRPGERFRFRPGRVRASAKGRGLRKVQWFGRGGDLLAASPEFGVVTPAPVGMGKDFVSLLDLLKLPGSLIPDVVRVVALGQATECLLDLARISRAWYTENRVIILLLRGIHTD